MEPQKQNDGVRYKLANAMKECMRTAPVEKITVKEIVETCGLTRQTFYRNFQDKYDLVHWVFDQILMQSFAHMGEGKTVYEALVNKFTYIREELIFFQAAFRCDTQNSLREHDFRLILAFYTDRITRICPFSDTLHFQLEMYCQGSVYMTVKWLMEGAQLAPLQLARQLCDAMPAELEKTFRRLELK